MRKNVHIMKFDVTLPYNDLPDLPPTQDIETKGILKKCIEARAALAELYKAAEMLPNQSVLINTLPLLEAQASSEIENIVTTSDKLFQYADHLSEGQMDVATKEALRYRAALKEGVDRIKKRPINTVLSEELCSIIRGTNMLVRTVPGTALSNQATREIIYTPPEGASLIRDKLYNWEKFLNTENNIDPLIKMAVGHYQFEAIHPFTDGNGRTGRILNILYLIEQKLLSIPVLYLSRYIIRNKSKYYKYLLNVTQHDDWESWIIYMLDAVEDTSKWTCAKITVIVELMRETREHVKKNLPGIYSSELVDILFVQPYCRISNLVEANIAQRQAASDYLKKLAKIKVVEEVERGREKIFINPRFMSVLLNENNTYTNFD